MSFFDDEIALNATGAGIFSGVVSPSWNIGTVPNGGYMACLAASALAKQIPQHPDPVSFTVHYLRPGEADVPLEIDAQILRSGASLSTGRATLTQQGKPRLEVLAAFGNLGVNPQTVATILPPKILPPEQCMTRSSEAQGVTLPIMQRLDILLNPDEFGGGQNAVGKAQITGWLRFKDGRAPDALSLLLFSDSFPPAIFGLLGMVGWVPTIELTVHVRRRPAPGWILGQFRTHDLADGRMIEDGALWDSTGALVAQSRQLAMLRRKE